MRFILRWVSLEHLDVSNQRKETVSVKISFGLGLHM